MTVPEAHSGCRCGTSTPAIEKLPVVDEQGRLKGLITIKDIEKRRKYPQACKDQLGRLVVGAP